ncbi:unnamed protein product, partial [Symbiodinium necroappetens]
MRRPSSTPSSNSTLRIELLPSLLQPVPFYVRRRPFLDSMVASTTLGCRETWSRAGMPAATCGAIRRICPCTNLVAPRAPRAQSTRPRLRRASMKKPSSTETWSRAGMPAATCGAIRRIFTCTKSGGRKGGTCPIDQAKAAQGQAQQTKKRPASGVMLLPIPAFRIVLDWVVGWPCRLTTAVQ